VVAALRSSFLTQGPLVNEFEKKIAAYCGAKYAVAFNSGTSALHGAYFSAGISKNDEVITSPITFAATSNAVLYCSGRPVFADVLEDAVNIDPKQIKKQINKNTKAVAPVHFAGQPADMEEISSIAKEHGLMVIEDAAHALGAEYKGSKIGACKYSDLTVLSFHAVKHIATGEGGMALTNNKEFYEKMIMFRSHGITREQNLLLNTNEGAWYYEMQLLGFNYRITDFQCALGISQLKKLGSFINKRRRIVERYNKAFEGVQGLKVLKEKEDRRSAWHIYPVMAAENRKKLFDHLRQSGIGANVHYIPVYLHPYYEKLGYKKGSCPNAESYYSQAVTLPLYPKMSDKDVDYVIETVLKGIKK
jgi:UDP-4-amino-4,6-dideoxy-N-acetyl-beta-L-altrosamine transaminase